MLKFTFIVKCSYVTYYNELIPEHILNLFILRNQFIMIIGYGKGTPKYSISMQSLGTLKDSDTLKYSIPDVESPLGSSQRIRE